MGVSIKEVAERAGVSRGTVSQVLNGNMSARITQQTRDRIQKIADEMGYEPNFLARSLGRRRTDTLGLMISGLTNPFFVDVMECVEELAEKAGYQVLMDASPSFASSYLERAKLRNWPVDGALVWAFTTQSIGDFVGNRAKDMPVVYMGYLRDDGADAVGFDLYQGGRTAGEYLVSRGFDRLAFVGPSYAADTEPPEARERGFFEVCAEHGLTAENIMAGGFEDLRSAGFDLGQQLAARTPAERPQAVFCHNDVMAVGLYHGFRRAGLKVPDDLAIVGFDGIHEGAYLDVPLTTILTQPSELCGQAFEILMKRLSGDNTTPVQQIAIPPRLVVRETA